MKKLYEQPEVEVLNFDVEDVITNSVIDPGYIPEENETPIVPQQ